MTAETTGTDRLAEISVARARIWRGAAELLAGEPAACHALRTPQPVAVWREALVLFADDTPRAHGALLVLETHARGARRRRAEDDLAGYRAQHDRLVRASPATIEVARQLAELCSAESTAWSTGDTDRARSARAEQVAVLRAGPDGALADLARLWVQEGDPLWRSLGTLLATFVVSETGRAPGGPRPRAEPR